MPAAGPYGAADEDVAMDDDEFRRRRQVFGQAVDVYDRTRPTYPAEAVAWCLGDRPGPLRVCDVGAGTGKLTDVLLDAGHEVVAVEPDPDMLARLVDRIGQHDRVTAHEGTAEALPVDDASVDAVIAGQAWHWFDERAVAPELGRVVRAGGTVAAVWNSRDEDVDWVAAWSRIAEEHAHPTGRKLLTSGEGPRFGADFRDRQAATFRHDHVLGPEGLVALAASRSWTIALPPDRRSLLLDAIADLARTHPDLAGREEIAMPYVVECFRARRR